MSNVTQSFTEVSSNLRSKFKPKVNTKTDFTSSKQPSVYSILYYCDEVPRQVIEDFRETEEREERGFLVFSYLRRVLAHIRLVDFRPNHKGRKDKKEIVRPFEVPFTQPLGQDFIPVSVTVVAPRTMTKGESPICLLDSLVISFGRRILYLPPQTVPPVIAERVLR